MTFYVVLIIIVLNLIFGVIIDTFGDLRAEKNEREFVLRNNCFICGLERSRFDNKSVTFEEHSEQEHNLWWVEKCQIGGRGGRRHERAMEEKEKRHFGNAGIKGVKRFQALSVLYRLAANQRRD